MKSPDSRLLVPSSSLQYRNCLRTLPLLPLRYYRKHALIWTCGITTYRASTSLPMTLPYEKGLDSLQEPAERRRLALPLFCCVSDCIQLGVRRVPLWCCCVCWACLESLFPSPLTADGWPHRRRSPVTSPSQSARRCLSQPSSTFCLSTLASFRTSPRRETFEWAS